MLTSNFGVCIADRLVKAFAMARRASAFFQQLSHFGGRFRNFGFSGHVGFAMLLVISG